MVHPLGIVENEIIHELPVEVVRILEQPGMVINKFLLDSAVEPFHVSVHLRCLGVSVIMRQVKPLQFLGKMFLKLGTVVRKNKKEIIGMRKCLLTQREELGSSQGGVTFGSPCKGESCIDILKGNYISPAAIYEPFHCI